MLGAFQRGLLLLAAGKSTLRLAPPLVVDEGDVDTALAHHRRPAGRAGLSADSKVATMRDAVAALVRDGDTVVIEGFTHLICFAAGHEIIRQRRRDLTLCRLTPDLIYDQMIAAGCARKLVFSWAGNPGAGSLHAFRRAVEKGDPPLGAGGVLPLRHGGPTERGRGPAPVLDPPRLHGDRPADGQPADPDASPALTLAKCWPPCRR